MKKFLPLSLALIMLGAGCGSTTEQVQPVQPSEPQQEQATQTQPEIVMPTVTTTPEATSTPAATSTPSTTSTVMTTSTMMATSTKTGTKTITPTTSLSITIQNFAFSPRSLTVKRGTKVVFSNQASVAHTATADQGAFNSNFIPPNQSFTLDTTKLQPGSYTYHCSLHPTMSGTLIIQ